MSPQKIQKRLKDFVRWTYDDATVSISRAYVLPSPQAVAHWLGLVQEIAAAAERFPTIQVRRQNVLISIGAEVGGFIERDFQLLERLDGLH